MPTLTILDNPNLFVPNPGGQQQFMDDYSHRYCALAGGWFAGKTWAGARKLIDLHLFNAFDHKNKPTGVKSAVIAPTYQLANDFDIPELAKAMDEMNLSCRFVADPKKYCFELPDLGTKSKPSEILIRTADAPERITGWTVGAIWGDEAARWKCDLHNPRNDPFIQADARLRDTKARFLQFMLTFTHEGDDTRVYRDFELDVKPDHVLYRSGTFQNPFAKSFGQVQQSQLTRELADQYLHGIATSTSSQRMYGSFNESLNIDADIKLNLNHPLQIAVDFNINPGMHCIIGQHFSDRSHPSDSHMTALAEIHESRMNVKQMCQALQQWIKQNYAPQNQLHGPLQIFGDASGSSQWAGGGESCYDILCESLRAAGIAFQLRIPSSNPHVADRVNAVNCSLCDAMDRQRYKIHPACKNLIDDYRLMHWGADGKPDKRDPARSHSADSPPFFSVTGTWNVMCGMRSFTLP